MSTTTERDLAMRTASGLALDAAAFLAETEKLRSVLRELLSDIDDVESGKLPAVPAATLARARQATRT